MLLRKFSQNPFICSIDIHSFVRRYHVGKPNLISFHGLVTLKMRSRTPKSYQLFPPYQPCTYASLVKIHPLVQKISFRKEATRTPTGSALITGRPVTYKTLYYPIFLRFTYKNLYYPIFFQNTYKNLYFWILDTQETKRLNKSPCIEQDVI